MAVSANTAEAACRSVLGRALFGFVAPPPPDGAATALILAESAADSPKENRAGRASFCLYSPPEPLWGCDDHDDDSRRHERASAHRRVRTPGGADPRARSDRRRPGALLALEAGAARHRGRARNGADPRAVHPRSVPSATRRRRGQVREQRSLPSERAGEPPVDVDGPTRAAPAAVGADRLVYPHRARPVEPAPGQGAGPLHAPVRHRGQSGAADARGALAGPGAAPSRRLAPRAPQPLAHARPAR